MLVKCLIKEIKRNLKFKKTSNIMTTYGVKHMIVYCIQYVNLHTIKTYNLEYMNR